VLAEDVGLGLRGGDLVVRPCVIEEPLLELLQGGDLLLLLSIGAVEKSLAELALILLSP
jgi:hypothetical protein